MQISVVCVWRVDMCTDFGLPSIESDGDVECPLFPANYIFDDINYPVYYNIIKVFN